MGVLLGLGHVELPQPRRGHLLGERVYDVLARKSDVCSEVSLVLGERHEVQARRHAGALERGEVDVDQRVAELAGAIGAEVEEHDGVTVLDAHARRGVGGDRRRGDELVCDTGAVLRLDVLHGVGCDPAPAIAGDLLEGCLGALPARVAVHRVVATGDAGHAAAAGGVEVGDEAAYENGRAGGRLVAPVGEGVEVHTRQAAPARQLRQRDGMCLVAVHATR